MIIEEKFVKKYKKQHYSQEITLQKLKNERKALTELLENINKQVHNSFEKACQRISKKNNVNEMTQRFLDKENYAKSSLKVDEAQLKNSQSYRRILNGQKTKLEHRLDEIQTNKKNQTVAKSIEDSKSNISNLKQVNMKGRLEINKLSASLIRPDRTLQQICLKLEEQVQRRKQKVLNKSTILYQIYQKNEQLQELVEQITEEIRNRIPNINSVHKLEVDLTVKLTKLQKKKQKLQNNIQSINTRLKQQYFQRLKQLDVLTIRQDKIDGIVDNVCRQIVQKNLQFTRSWLSA